DGGSAPPIRCPGLLVAGGDDFGGDLGPYERSRAFWDAPLDILVIDGAGHWPHREGEARFVRELVAFVAGVN
ncbi:MAG: hypothetical protein OEU32_15400, partial [Acidimicrobiia bacterium]|nr:hypothetical protein [Acidimicrobiia bacterium]